MKYGIVFLLLLLTVSQSIYVQPGSWLSRAIARLNCMRQAGAYRELEDADTHVSSPQPKSPKKLTELAIVASIPRLKQLKSEGKLTHTLSVLPVKVAIPMTSKLLDAYEYDRASGRVDLLSHRQRLDLLLKLISQERFRDHVQTLGQWIKDEDVRYGKKRYSDGLRSATCDYCGGDCDVF